MADGNVGAFDEAACPIAVDSPIMIQRWEQLSFIHWEFDRDDVQRLVPPELTVETFEGRRAFVGLVPFRMHVATPRGRSLPWVSAFAETNVRTYVSDRRGRRGVWFFSLDAARLAPVLVARATYRLPYFWARMTVSLAEGVVDYRSQRRFATGNSTVSIRIGQRYDPDELTALDHFLTARWTLFSSYRNGVRVAHAAHEPWPLHRAELRSCDDQLLRAAGLSSPRGEPLVHFSPGVEARISRPGH